MPRSDIDKRKVEESDEAAESMRIGHTTIDPLPQRSSPPKTKNGPLPKASPELAPPTSHGKEAVGVGYQLAKNKKKKRGGSTYA